MTLKEFLVERRKMLQSPESTVSTVTGLSAEHLAFITNLDARKHMETLLRIIEVQDEALENITGDKDFVESQSTGAKQWFVTGAAKIAIAARARVEAMLKGEDR